MEQSSGARKPRAGGGESHQGRPAGARKEAAVEAVLFDFDGTLTLPGHLDFAAIRSAIGCPPGGSLLAFIDGIADNGERERAARILDEFETAAADRSREDPDAAAVIRSCRERGLALAIITRNSRRSVERSFAHFSGTALEDFATLITRDDPVSAKPEPDGVLLACERLGVRPAAAMLVGDFLYDIEAGERAGAVTVFYDSDPQRGFDRPSCDYTIKRLSELIELVGLHQPLPAGKVPNALLARFLSARQDVRATDPTAAEAKEANQASLLVGPGVGEDVAAIAAEEAQAGGVLLVKSDPITFVAEDFGHYLLTVNANDIVTAGGTPRWLLATLLVPPGTLGVAIGRLFADLTAACEGAGVVLCGGHTELTDAVTRPVVNGTMIGTVEKQRLIKKSGMAQGDVLLLTKALAVEGTAILASEYAPLVRRRGIDEATIGRAAALRTEMSIRPEAEIAVSEGGTSAMHDVTEGGVATALRELSTAGGHRLRVELDRIPVLAETSRICGALGIDPLGLIASGSLLITVRRGAADRLLARFEEAGIAVCRIGEVLERGVGVEAERAGKAARLPEFAVDELARLEKA